MEVDQLYGLPLDRFVSERDALARRLRKEGRSQDASRVAKLRKPALAAWGANQALRSQPAAARELRAAGTSLSRAQNAAIHGDANRDEVRQASERHRLALQRLVDAARGLLDSKGHALSSATIERVVQTLNAASLDPSLAREAQEAHLEQEHFYTGFDELASTANAKPRRPKRARSRPKPHGSTIRATTADEPGKREITRKRQADQINAANQRLSEAGKQTATAAKARDAAARDAKTAAKKHRSAEDRYEKALEAETRARARLEALRHDGD